MLVCKATLGILAHYTIPLYWQVRARDELFDKIIRDPIGNRVLYVGPNPGAFASEYSFALPDQFGRSVVDDASREESFLKCPGTREQGLTRGRSECCKCDCMMPVPGDFADPYRDWLSIFTMPRDLLGRNIFAGP